MNGIDWTIKKKASHRYSIWKNQKTDRGDSPRWNCESAENFFSVLLDSREKKMFKKLFLFQIFVLVKKRATVTRSEKTKKQTAVTRQDEIDENWLSINLDSWNKKMFKKILLPWKIQANLRLTLKL